MSILGNGLLIFATTVGIPTVLLLQFILGYKQLSSDTGKVTPIIYGLLLTFFVLTTVHDHWTLDHTLFLSSQWLVSYFFYSIYLFGKAKSIQKIGVLNANAEDHTLGKNRI